MTLALQNAQSPEEANDILAQAWKFAGYNRPGGGEYAARLGTTRAYLNGLPEWIQGRCPPRSRPLCRVSTLAGLSSRLRMLPQQTASGEPDAANMPVRSAVPAGFVIPGSDFGAQARSLPSSDPNARNALPPAQVGLPGATVAAQRGLDPALLARA